MLLYRAYPPLAAFVGVWAVLFVSISFWLATRCRIYSRKAAAARSDTTGIIVDAVTNLNSSRLFAQLGFERHYLNEQLRRELKEVRKSNWYSERIRWFQFISAAILILDEATSSLDSIAEKAIQDTLDSVMDGKTVIVVAHRLSTIADLDRILVFDQGRIVEDGTHPKLLARRGAYYKLWKMQAGGFLPVEAEPGEEKKLIKQGESNSYF